MIANPVKIYPSGKVTIYQHPGKLLQYTRERAEKNRRDKIRAEMISIQKDFFAEGKLSEGLGMGNIPRPGPGYGIPKKRNPFLSAGSKNKVYDSMSLLYQRKKGRAVFFYTFTMPVSQADNNITDAQVSKKFSKFLNNYRTNHGLINYVWIAEIQTLNTGNIHYHLVTDKYLNPLVMSVKWEKMWGRGFRNSIDKKIVYNLKDLRGYLTKYITKLNEGLKSRPIYSRRIGRSLSLSDKPVYADTDDVSDLHLIKIWEVCKQGRKYRGYQFDFKKVIEIFFPPGSEK